MRKLSILLIIGALFPFASFASTDYPTEALRWWLKNEKGGKNASFVASEDKENPKKYVIADWNVDGVSKPSDSEIETIISDYNNYVTQKKSDDDSAMAAVKTKLNLTDSDVKALKALIS